MDMTRCEPKNYHDYPVIEAEWLQKPKLGTSSPTCLARFQQEGADLSTKWSCSYGIIPQSDIGRLSYLEDHFFVAFDLPCKAPVVTRTTTELAKWLDRYGLGEYAQTFAENHIDFSVLPDLTENDLEKLGVLLGHRKKLLRAIEALSP